MERASVNHGNVMVMKIVMIDLMNLTVLLVCMPKVFSIHYFIYIGDTMTRLLLLFVVIAEFWEGAVLLWNLKPGPLIEERNWLNIYLLRHLIVLGNATCANNEFQCGRQCIPTQWVCDGNEDCHPNGEDEKNCNITPAPKTCPTGKWACANHDCISSRWRCDGDADIFNILYLVSER